MVSGLMSMFLTNFVLIFVCGVSYFTFSCRYTIFLMLFVKETVLSPLRILGAFVGTVDRVWGFIARLSVVQLAGASLLCRHHCYVSHCSSVLQVNTRTCELSESVLITHCSGIFCGSFHSNSRTVFSTSVKNATGISIGIT